MAAFGWRWVISIPQLQRLQRGIARQENAQKGSAMRHVIETSMEQMPYSLHEQPRKIRINQLVAGGTFGREE
ncbi:hypothetical protein KCP70_10855 [Salmonella enterica subsp. enterica]|nr:hypothetical protein KCP70_10855 [Salmonella enterica subsp. enterica]